MRRQLVPALRMVAVLTVLCGLLYPLAMTGVAQALFSDKADGSLIERDGEVVGSSLVGQSFTAPEYFHTRPSAAGALASGSVVQDVDDEGNPVGDPHPADPADLSLSASGPSNQGPTNADLLSAIEARVADYREVNDLDDDVPVPIDAVTASSSGVDPHISVANARLQAARVAAVRSLSLDAVLELVDEHTVGRSLGFLGERGVNVLELNLALDAARRLIGPRPYPAAMARGSLRLYLGAAPGVGKTYAMLNEGTRRHERGTDVVVAFVETHGRPNTAAQLDGLEVIPRRQVTYRGTTLEEMDTEAVIARAPAVALVDELAHTNAPGSRHEKRWQDVEQLRDAGIDVISTLNIQHLESLNDVVERITGVKQRETIPDDVARGADQVEIVDMAPEALRRRMAHGNIYAAEKVDAALANYFRLGNLGALRELALMWVADQVDVALQDYKAAHGILDTWETRERVVVALTGAPSGEQLIRRAARMATRTHGDLVGLHVKPTDGLASGPTELLQKHRELLEGLGGEYQEVAGGNVASALTDFARAENATQLVLGASGRSRWAELVSGSVINDVVRAARGIDVHVISVSDGDGDHADRPVDGTSRRRRLPTVSRRRRQIGWWLVALGIPLLTLALTAARDTLSLTSDLLLYLLLVVVAAAVGGVGPAVAAAVGGFLCANWFLTPPYHRLTIAESENALALVIFLLVGGLVGFLVLQASAHAAATTRSQAEIEVLQEASARERRATEEAAAEALLRARADDLRVSLLRAVSHDLRTPLASIKASVTSLLQRDVDWTEEATQEFLRTIDEESDRLDDLVGNLLDLSRLQSGALRFQARPVGYEEVVPAALASLSGPTEGVEIHLDETLPRVQADPALLERVVANLAANAISASHPSKTVRIEAGAVGERVDLRIVDRGRGIPVADRERIFEPFQRRGDGGGGVGLGLAVAKGFVDAMGGELTVEDTPGGGITMVVGMPMVIEA